MQGVSINIFVKTGKKKANELGKVFHYDLYGKREYKYDFLRNNSLKTVEYKELPNVKPNYFFVSKDFEEQKEYNKGFSINELFPVNSVGIVTARDNFTIHDSKEDVQKTIDEFLILDDETSRKRFDLGKDVRDWQVNFARTDLQNNYPNNGKFCKVTYRPFDDKWTFFSGKSKGFHCYPRNEVMQHFVKGDNLGLFIGRQGQVVGSMTWNLAFITKNISDFNLYYRGGGISFPLYLYNVRSKTVQSNLFDQPVIYSGKEISNESSILEEPQFAYRSLAYRPNLSQKIVREIEKCLGIPFIVQQFKTGNDEFGEVDLLDYIYAVLHSPTYREKYKEFLKIDFPRIPFPKDTETFWKLVKLGGEIRQIHLLESPTVEEFITQYPIDGDNVIKMPKYFPISKNEITRELQGNVYINDTQFFANVPLTAWSFYIGGYQPAQKWLKDRKERQLEFDDILHYQKIIVALTKTDRIMKEIDKVGIE